MQAQLLSTMAETAVLYCNTVSSTFLAIAENMENGKPGTDRSESDTARESAQPKDAWSVAFDAPELPAAGQSWYRAPYENPVLAFFGDQMLQPWRTYSSAALPGIFDLFMPRAAMAGVFMPSTPFDFMLNIPSVMPSSAMPLSVMQWLQKWGQTVAAMQPATDFANFTSWARMFSPGEMGDALQWPAFGNHAAGYPIARVVFPGSTEISNELPFALPSFWKT